jgi:U4/U6.U5 tri-snRNP component SNU23
VTLSTSSPTSPPTSTKSQPSSPFQTHQPQKHLNHNFPHHHTPSTAPTHTSNTVLTIKSHTTMADRKGAYNGAPASDTSFRKTWDREEYAQKAVDRESRLKEEGKAKYEAAAAGKKYHRRASTPPDARDTEARRTRLDVSAQIGKTMLVPAGSAVGKRGKGAGFWCDACDLTFKDNLQFVEHLNSKQHLYATGQSGEVKRATLQDVVERLDWLKRKREEEKAKETVDLGTRLEVAREAEEKARAEKRRRRNEKRRKNKGGEEEVKVEVENDGVIC